MSKHEIPLFFECDGEELLGICHLPESHSHTGVVIVVGGPQYRVGSHRQFVLLARYLAEQGIPVFRFDCRGMGDSSGELKGFEKISLDIRTAIDTFFQQVPQLNKIVLWGLCDAASAVMMYAHADPRVCGQVLLNPWVRTEEGQAKVHLKSYYAKRVLDKDFWKKNSAGGVDLQSACSGFASTLKKALSGSGKCEPPEHEPMERPYLERMVIGFKSFSGKTLLVLSGNDLTADEFRLHVANSECWQTLLADKNVTQKTLADANHTFSKAVWRDQVAVWCAEWVKGL